MRRLTHARPSPALVVAVLALVAAVAGSAVAEVATTSRLNKKEKKQTRKIARKQINKLAPDLSVDHANTADNATNAQNADNATNAQNADNATNAQNAVNAQNAANADALDGLNADQIRPLGRDATATGCDPSTTTFANCASVDLTLPASGRVLLVGDITWHSDTSPASGLCRLAVDGPQIGDTAFPGELLDVTNGLHEIGQGLNAVTGILGPGPHAFRLQCNEEQGDIDYDEAWLSAVYIGAA